jgi:hypothetical protein
MIDLVSKREGASNIETLSKRFDREIEVIARYAACEVGFDRVERILSRRNIDVSRK